MGEVYKGLTIRIGADMSNLERALSKSNSAIRQTESQLRKLQRAMKTDPEGWQLVNRTMEVTAGKASGISKKLVEMREQMARLKSQTSAFGDLGNLMKDAEVKATQAQYSFARVDEEIAKLKNNVIRLKGLNADVFDDVKGDAKATAARMRELGVETETVDRYVALAAEHFKRLNELNFANIIASTANLKTELKATEAQSRSVYLELAKMAYANPAVKQTDEFKRLRAQMQLADNAADQLRSDFKMLDEAARLDPTSMEAARLKMSNMQEQTRLLIERMGRLQEQMGLLGKDGIAEASAEMRDLSVQTQRAQERFSRVNQELDEAKATLNALRAEPAFDELSSDAVRSAQRVEKLQSELRQVEAALRRLGAVRAFREVQQDMARTAAEANNLLAKMSSANSALSGISGAMQQLGWATYSTVTPAVTMFAYSAINSAREVDSAYRDMRKTVEGTEEQFSQLRDAAIDFSRTHVTTADTILEIEAMGGQLGISVENLGEFASVVSSLDIATDLDADTAAQQLGQLSGILKDMSQKDFRKYGDALVRLGNNSATLESHIADVMLRISSMGTIVGFSTPELLAWSTAVASTGQGAEAAGTAISKTMSDIEGAVGAGGDSLAAFAKVAQMSSDEFASTWKNDPSSAMHAFIDGLNAVEEQGGSADQTLESLGITSVRQKQAILGLTQTISGLNKSLEMSNDAWNGVDDQFGKAGDAMNEATKKSEGFSGAVQILLNNFHAFGIEVGESIAPAIGALNDVVQDLTGMYHDLPGEVKMAIDVLGLFLAALGPVTVTMNAFSRAGGSIMKSLVNKGAWAQVVKQNGRLTRELAATAAQVAACDGNAKRLGETYEKMTGKQKALMAGAGLLKGALVGLGVAGLAFLASKIVDVIGKEQDLYDATSGLSRAVGQMYFAKDFTASIESISSSVGTLRGVSTAVENAIKSQAELAKAISERRQGTQDSIALMDDAYDVLDRLTSKYDENGLAVQLNASEQGQLEAAVKRFNDQCGTNIEVIDAVNGKIGENGEAYDNASAALDRYMEKKKIAIQLDAAEQDYAELYKQVRSDAEALANAKQAAAAAEAEYNAVLEDGTVDASSYAQKAADAATAVDHAQAAYDRAQSALKRTTDEMNTLAGATSGSASAFSKFVGENWNVRDALLDTGADIQLLDERLTAAGVSTETLNNIGSEQFAELARSCNGDINKIIAKIIEVDGKSANPTISVNDQASPTIDIIAAKLTNIARDYVANVITNTISRAVNEKATGGVVVPHAAGGVRMHAAGFIATGPTMISPRDMIGEDGAEYYDGKHIVPLTNRKYSQPFIDMISAEVSATVLRSLGAGGRGASASGAGQVSVGDMQQAFAAALSQAGGATVNVIVDGRSFSDNIAPYMAVSLGRLDVRSSR